MTLKSTLVFILTIFLGIATLNAQKQNLFLTDPVIDPSGNYVVFCYDGDLWKVSSEGGVAARLTAMDGNESRPNISPDGKWIAFSSTQFGNKDIYIMPSAGGDIKQLTFHQSFDDVESWSWDSQNIYFSSNRFNRFTSYKININGNTPQRLFDHYFHTTHNTVEHPTSGEIFFNETWESKNFSHRKGYKGEYNPDIKSYNPQTKAYKEYTSYNGKDFGASIDKNGQIYFMSDEHNGQYNLYTFISNVKTRLTDFTDALYWPKVSANGSKVVFQKNYEIIVYDVKSKTNKALDIQLNKNYTLDKKEDFNISGNISYFNVSADGKKLCFVSRGRLFVSDIKGKFIKEVNTNNQEAVQEALWTKDSKEIIFSQTKKGYYNLYRYNAQKESSPIELTSKSENIRNLHMNSDRSKVVFMSGRNNIEWMDLKTYKSEIIAQDELWGLYNSSVNFSPDDRYISFTAYRNFELDIFLYDTKTKTVKNISNTNISETDPVWSPDGKHMYFVSDRLNPSYPYGTRNARVYQLPLQRFNEPFKADKFSELFKEEEKKGDDKKDDKKKKDKGDDKKDDDKKKVEVAIEFDGLMDRLNRIGPGFGQQKDPYVIHKDGKTTVLYLSNHEKGDNYLYKTTFEDFEKSKTEKIGKSKVNFYKIVKADGKHYMMSGGSLYTLNVDGGKMEKISLSHNFSKSKHDEFHQMYYEAWAGVETNFYDENFHGVNWQEQRDKYAKILPSVNRRSDLRRLINDMLGELNTSHFGFYSNGKEEQTYFGFQTAATGLLFNKDRPYVVDKIVKEGPSDYYKLDIRKGDQLIKVNDKVVDQSQNRNFYFYGDSRPDELVLEFKRGPETIVRKIHPSSYNSISTLLYDEWQDANQAYVDQKSGNKIAYVHMKNMTNSELIKFKLDMTKDLHYKEALIFDLRYNTGGNVHDDVLRFLSQKKYLNWKYREGKLTKQSNFNPADKPIVLLINEQSLSDAEMTASGFKQLGLGTVMGTETYRWIIFTSGMGLVDGSFYRLPSWGCYTLDGDNLEKTGVKPDIRVEKDFKNRITGDHPQLDRAIDFILEKLK